MKTEYYFPKNFEELDTILQSVDRKVTYVAGATDIMIQPGRWQSADILVSMTDVMEACQTLHPCNDGFLIGASVPLSRIIEDEFIKQNYTILRQACRQIGSVQIQNRATLGGNIANASPAGDTLPVLSVYDARLWIGPRRNGEFRQLRLDEVMSGPGQITLPTNDYIAYVYLPMPDPENLFTYFRKVGQRYSMAISKLSLAVLGWLSGNGFNDLRISAGSVSPQIKRADRTEKLLVNRKLAPKLIEAASEQLAEEISPITDIRSTISYRRKISQSLLREALQLAGKRMQANGK